MRSELLKRLEALTQHRQPVAVEAITDDEFLRQIEAALELPAGSLPRDASAAAAQGYDSVIDALADALGLTYQELKNLLTSR